jgi:hypothetical protein
MLESHQEVINMITNRHGNISEKILIIKNSDTRISNPVISSVILNITECKDFVDWIYTITKVLNFMSGFSSKFFVGINLKIHIIK